MAAKFMASNTGPQPVEPSPLIDTVMECSPASFLRSAAPVAMPAEAPTMALLG